MNRFLTACLLVSLLHLPALAQREVEISTFTIEALREEVGALSLPSSLRRSLEDRIEQAEEAYERGASERAIVALGEFRTLLDSQPAGVVPVSASESIMTLADRISDALSAGFLLGGAFAGPDGLILNVADTNSPLYRARLAIPPGALGAETRVTLSVESAEPRNRALSFPGSGLVLGPRGLALSEPATLELPYGDRDRDGLVDATDYPVRFLKTGVVDGAGRIAFPPRELDTTLQVQRIRVYDFLAYRNVAWRWAEGVLTYSLVWPEEGIALASGIGMDDLRDAVRDAIAVWSSALKPAGIRFDEVPAGQPAVVRFGFFSPDAPLRVLDSNPVEPGLGRGLGDGAAQIYAQENPLEAGEGFAVTFNGDFGRGGEDALVWSADHQGGPDEVSIESVAIHAVGHVIGLDDVPDTLQPPMMATGADLMNPEVCLSFEDLAALAGLYPIPADSPGACPHARLGGLPEAHAFGQVPSAAERVVELAFGNTGTGTLLIGDASLEGDGFRLDTSVTRTTLRPGESTSLKIRLLSGGAGAAEGFLRLATNAPDSPALVRLSGTRRDDVPGCTLTPAPGRILSGERTTLTWAVSGHAATAELGDEIGEVNPAGGSVEVRPEATKRYTLSLSGPAGSGACDTTIVVEHALSSELVWKRQLGGPGRGSVRAIATADFGVAVGGEVGGASGGGGEGILALYDTAGDLIWEQRLPASGIEGLALDSTGIYAAGLTGDSLEGEEHRGGVDLFLGKFDLEGNLVWLDQFGTAGVDRASGVAVDATGVYIVGVTDGTLDNVAAGGLDVVVRKYSSGGDILWVRQFGTVGDDNARGVAALADGIVVVGDTSGAFAGHERGGGSDAFLRRYDADGSTVWTRQFGGPGSQSVAAVAADLTGIYVAGGTGTALAGQASVGGDDAFLRRYGLDGREVWTRQFGTSGADSVSSLGVDETGLFVAGASDGTLHGQVGAGGSDAFVRAIDFGGQEIWTRQFGTPETDDALALGVGEAGVYVGGSTLGALPESGTTDSGEAFFAKIRK